LCSAAVCNFPAAPTAIIKYTKPKKEEMTPSFYCPARFYWAEKAAREQLHFGDTHGYCSLLLDFLRSHTELIGEFFRRTLDIGYLQILIPHQSFTNYFGILILNLNVCSVGHFILFWQIEKENYSGCVIIFDSKQEFGFLVIGEVTYLVAETKCYVELSHFGLN